MLLNFLSDPYRTDHIYDAVELQSKDRPEPQPIACVTPIDNSPTDNSRDVELTENPAYHSKDVKLQQNPAYQSTN